METQVTSNAPGRDISKKTYALNKKADGLPAPRVIHGNTISGIQNMAAFSKTAMGDTTSQPTFWYSPELSSDSWLLPKTRVETLRFCQIYYNLDPYIHSILNMHAQYGFSKFYLQYKDPDITTLFNKLLFYNQDFDWYQFTLDVALSYWKYGEAVVWGSWNSARRTWDRFTLINPAIVEYKEDLMTGHATMELIPTNEMKRIVKDALLQGRRDIDPLLLNAIENNKKLPLDTEGIPENVFTGQDYVPPKVFMFQRRTDPSSERGTSALQCARGSTKVKLLDGTTPTMEELYRSGKKNFWVYAIDNENKLVFKKADYVIHKGRALTYDVTLDNGQVLGFTEDHLFMLRDGSYKPVKDLKPGDALMPLYVNYKKLLTRKGTKTNSRYEYSYDPSTGTNKLTHVRVMLQEKRDSMRLHGSRVIHHKDFNSKNNTPENLVFLSRSEHAQIHESHTASHTPEWYKEFSKLGLASRDMRKHSELMKSYWADENYRKKIHNKQVAVHANRSFAKKLLWKKHIGDTNARKYDEKRFDIAESIQNAVNSLSEKSEHRPSLTEIAAVVGLSPTTVFNYINKYKLVFLPNKPQKKTTDFDFKKVAAVQKYFDENSNASIKEVAKACNIFSGTIHRYIKNGLVVINKYEYKNHKVVSVKPAIMEDVYDIHSVDETHNYMVCTEDGSGVCVHNCLFKDLYLKDVLRMSQIAVAQKTQLPIELWTVGHMGNDEQSSMLPGPELLEEVRQMITQATQQPPFSIVYGPYLKYEALGVTGKLLDIYNDLGYVENQILVGLGVNKAVVLGEGPSVQGKAISLNRLVREYAVVRDLFSNWFKRNILLPIAKANHLVDEEGQYILPNLVWELSLQPEQDKETFDMFYKMWKDGLISTMTLFEKCPKQIDYTLEMQRLSDEVGTPFDKGDKRLGKNTTADAGGSAKGGDSELDTAKSKGVEAGKGNPELRDFALGGGADDTLGDLETDIPAEGEAGGAEEVPEPMEGE